LRHLAMLSDRRNFRFRRCSWSGRRRYAW
jgi:hypothetical protein